MVNTSNINDKIRILSFLCTIMVLFRHSRNLIAFWGTENVNNFTAYFENTMSTLTEVAVPSFFIISGYFFFKYDYYDTNNYFTMLKKKIRTLVIPFIIWNIIGAIILSFYEPSKIGHSIESSIYNLLLSKWNGPLWYIRDLILLMLISPIYLWIFKLNNKILYIIILIILFFRWCPIDTDILSTEGQLFFFLGGVIRMNKGFIIYKIPILFFIFILLLWCIYSLNIFHLNEINFHRLNTIIGVMIVWRFIDFFSQRFYNFLYNLTCYSFFIYVMHAYLVKFIKRTISYLYYENDFIALLTYILVPLLTIVISINLAKYWKRKFNKSYNIVTGGR